MKDNLESLLEQLVSEGCHPCISWRSDRWRAHVNGAGNFWDESKESPLDALNRAARAWERAGKPMDGYASI